MIAIAGANILNYTFPMNIRYAVFLVYLSSSLCAHAEIYKSIDADGHVTYSNVPSKSATRLNFDPPDKNTRAGGPPPSSRSPTPAGFPKVDQNTQKQRDNKRREILEGELAAERKALEQAKATHADASVNPEIFQQIVGPDGKPVLGAREGDPVKDASGNTVIGADGNPATYRKQRGRNMAKYAEKMDQLSSEIKNHENNIEMLEREMSKM